MKVQDRGLKLGCNFEYLWTRAGIVLLALPLFLASPKPMLWAQANPSAGIGQALQAHGAAWQNGGVKNWVATGQIIRFRYDAQGKQSYDAFPMTLIHAADPAGGGGAGDKLQRLIFRQPNAAGMVNIGTATAPAYSLYSVLMKEGTDGSQTWDAALGMSTTAAGGVKRFIESQTTRSLEALFNYRGHGKSVADITARIQTQHPAGATPPAGGAGHGQPDFVHPRSVAQAAANAQIIEMGDGSGKFGSTTRYYIDKTTRLVTRMEFDFGQAQDPFNGQMHTLTEVYEFSNYQDVPVSPGDPFGHAANAAAGTVKFPMEIDRYVVGQKVETMIFSSVLMNANLSPGNFKK